MQFLRLGGGRAAGNLPAQRCPEGPQNHRHSALPNSNQPLRRVLSGKRRAEPGALRSQARRWERRRQASRSRRRPLPSRAISRAPCRGEALGRRPAPPGRSRPIQSNPIGPPRQRVPVRPGRSWPYAGALLHFGSTRLDRRLKSGVFLSRNPCASQARGYPLSRGSA